MRNLCKKKKKGKETSYMLLPKIAFKMEVVSVLVQFQTPRDWVANDRTQYTQRKPVRLRSARDRQWWLVALLSTPEFSAILLSISCKSKRHTLTLLMEGNANP